MLVRPGGTVLNKQLVLKDLREEGLRIRSIELEDAAVRHDGDREQSGERPAFGRLEPARLGFCRIDRGKPALRDADQEAPVGMQRKTAGIAIELRDQRARRKAGPRQF